MASPQAEDGHIDIANETAEALMRINFSAYQMRVLWAIWRKTYGWHKKEDHIPVSQITKMTKLHHAHVSRALKELELMNVITRTQRGTRERVTICFQKNYDKWQPVPRGVYRKLVPNGAHTRTQRGTKLVPNGADSKEKKETIQKKRQKAPPGKPKASSPLGKYLNDNPQIHEKVVRLRLDEFWDPGPWLGALIKEAPGVNPDDIVHVLGEIYRKGEKGNHWGAATEILKERAIFRANQKWAEQKTGEKAQDPEEIKSIFARLSHGQAQRSKARKSEI